MGNAIVKAVACISIAAMVIGIAILKDTSMATLLGLFSLIAIGIIATRK